MEELYYTDPLAASIMMRDFGVKILGKRKSVPHISLSTACNYAGQNKKLQPEKLIVCPDSYDVFDLKLWDVVEFDGIVFGSVIGIDDEGMVGVQCENDVYAAEIEECTILNRDEKPFFNPIKEVA